MKLSECFPLSESLLDEEKLLARHNLPASKGNRKKTSTELCHKVVSIATLLKCLAREKILAMAKQRSISDFFCGTFSADQGTLPTENQGSSHDENRKSRRKYNWHCK